LTQSLLFFIDFPRGTLDLSLNDNKNIDSIAKLLNYTLVATWLGRDKNWLEKPCMLTKYQSSKSSNNIITKDSEQTMINRRKPDSGRNTGNINRRERSILQMNGA